jgi:hypothetical protein
MGGSPDKNEGHDGDGDEMALDPRIQEAIGKSLKAHYDDLVNAPIPDRLLVLLAELEAKERHDGQ